MPQLNSPAPAPTVNEAEQIQIALDPTARMNALLAKVRQTRAHALHGRGAIIEGDPAKRYVWVSTNEHQRIEFESMGYKQVTNPKVKTNWKQADGTHRRGDLILYEIDQEMYEAIKVDDQFRALESIQSPKEMLRTMIEREGGRVFEPAPK